MNWNQRREILLKIINRSLHYCSSANPRGGVNITRNTGVKFAGIYMDFLTIESEYSWSREVKVFYASCRNLTANNSDAKFIKFYQCHFEKLNINDSKLYWVEFFNCEIFGGNYENSKLFNINFDNSSFNSFSFYRVEVQNIMYKPPKKEYYSVYASTCETIADNYKRFRVLYQSNGLRKDAADAYYKERIFEMKYHWYSSKLWESITHLWKRNFKYAISEIKHYTSRLIGLMSSSISYMIWGFGEKPHRIIFSSLIVISLYAFLFFLSDIDRLSNNVLNSFYLSIVTFTTLGFGDITPLTSDSYKIIVASEALFGAFLMGLLVAGYSNKSRY